MDSTGPATAPLERYERYTSKKTADIRPLDQQSTQLLATVNGIASRLENAEKLWSERHLAFTQTEGQIILDAFDSVDTCLLGMDVLLEPTPTSLEIAGTNISIKFIVRDSPNLQSFLAQLGIASNHLSTAIMLLCSRTSGPTPQTPPDVVTGPPSYGESQFLNASRSKNLARRLAVLPSRSQSAPAQHLAPSNYVPPAMPQISMPQISELPGDAEFGAARRRHHPTELQAFELDGGYIPYRHVHAQRHSVAVMSEAEPVQPAPSHWLEGDGTSTREEQKGLYSQSLPERLTTVETISSQEPLMGRARSRRWLESQAARRPT